MQKFAVVFVLRAVFEEKAYLKPPNDPYYLFVFLSPKLVKSFVAVIEQAFLNPYSEPRNSPPVHRRRAITYTPHTSRDEAPAGIC